MYGRFADSNSCTALRIWPEWPLVTGLYERSETDLIGSYLHGVFDTSFGMSISTGPGRPVRAIKNAFLTVAASSRTSLTRKLCLTQGRVMPTVSHSWNASWPIAAVGTWPLMMTSGMESMWRWQYRSPHW